jgi:hypothetical protein
MHQIMVLSRPEFTDTPPLLWTASVPSECVTPELQELTDCVDGRWDCGMRLFVVQ